MVKLNKIELLLELYSHITNKYSFLVPENIYSGADTTQIVLNLKETGQKLTITVDVNDAKEDK
jgi:hypothetical protein